MSKLSPKEKALTCLNFIDQQLENTSQQTIEIAEMMIEDIKRLNEAHQQAEQGHNLANYLEQMNHLQLNWINQLQEIILEQTNRDLNGQVIVTLNNFINKLSDAHTKSMDFPLPSVVGRQIGDHEEEDKYLDQNEIELLLSDQESSTQN